MAAGAEPTRGAASASRFAQGAWTRAWPAALFVAVLAVAAVAVQAPASHAPEVELTVEATAPVAWTVTSSGHPLAPRASDALAWHGATTPDAAFTIDAITITGAQTAPLALRVTARRGARSGELLVWGGHAEIRVAELLHGDAP